MPKPLPVLLMIRELGHGGSERQLTEMAKSLDRSRFTPHVGYFREGMRVKELRAVGVPILELPVRSFRSFGAVVEARRLGRYIREHDIQIVHTFDPPLNCFGAPVARFYRAPVVLTSQRSHRELRTAAFRRLLRITDRIADGIVVPCQAVHEHLVKDERVSPDKIRLCYNGIDLERFPPGPRQRRPEVADAPLVIGVVAVLRPEKGLSTLLEAFARIVPDHPQARLVIVGSGPVAESLVALAARLGVTDKCVFRPTTNEVASWLHTIDIFVLPSLSEAFSNSIMEAMACGCAVVASRVGGNPELVIDGKTGLLFEKGDPLHLESRLRMLIDNADLRRQLAENAIRGMCEKYSLAASANRMGEIYEEFLQRRIKRRRGGDATDPA